MAEVTVDATESPTIRIPEPRVVMDRVPPPPPQPVGFTLLALAVAAGVGAGLGFYAHRVLSPSPRRNPSCCASCARGGSCRSRHR